MDQGPMETGNVEFDKNFLELWLYDPGFYKGSFLYNLL